MSSRSLTAIVAVAGACGRLEFTAVPPDAMETPVTSRSLSASQTFSCAITSGTLRCWGDNVDGQLGTGDTTLRLDATVIAPERAWRAVVAGTQHTCALAEAGEVYCWGDNANGQLGVGDFNARLVADTPVPLPAAVVELEGRDANTCAVLVDGGLQCWGDNAEGQLANNTNMDSPLPVNVMPASTWSHVSSGQAHTLAIATDGTLWGSGRNNANELALPLPASGQVRVMNAGPSGLWSRIAAGQNHSCAIDAAERMYCWGVSMYGGLGVGDTLPRDVPTEVMSTTSWRTVSTHTFETCGIDTTGRLWCWGRNVEGQLGTGDTTDRLVPTDVSLGFSDWVDVAVGRFHACAMRADDSVYCTGANNTGQLGTGTMQRRNTFSLVTF